MKVTITQPSPNKKKSLIFPYLATDCRDKQLVLVLGPGAGPQYMSVLPLNSPGGHSWPVGSVFTRANIAELIPLDGEVTLSNES